MPHIQRALLSVSDKTGLEKFARGLAELDVELISTGGTARALTAAGLTVTGVSGVTKSPEMLEGRVKTLHPAIHGGLLADRSKPEHMDTIARMGITPIDMVVVNLYPFAQTIAKPDVAYADAIENIDIGGPAMIRSAGKNHASVAVVVSPEDYEPILLEMQTGAGQLSSETLAHLAAKAFAHTSEYDAMITKYLSSQLAVS